MKKFLKIASIVILVLIILFIAAVAIFLKSKLSKINYEKISKDDIDINEGIAARLDGYTNIALLGIDKGESSGDSVTGNGRSDCIMIISINNKTKEVNLVSVYRDTYLRIEGYELDKVNHAYAYGNTALSLSTLNTNLDLNITEFVRINFDSVIKIVDAMGGVTIDVSSAEATQIPGIYGAGTYNLSGKQALAYGRIRKIDNDYVRTERMRNVVIKLFEKAKNMSYSELNKLIDELLPCLTTNLSQSEILGYASRIKQYKVKKDFGWPYDVRAYIGAAWYGAPVTLESNVKKLHEELFNEENYEVSNTVKEISKKIINRTGYSN